MGNYKKRGFKGFRGGFTAIEFGIVAVIIAIASIAILVKMSGETTSAVVDGLKQEMSVVVTKTRTIAQQRSDKYKDLTPNGLKVYGDTIPYKIADDKIYSQIAGGCTWVTSSTTPFVKFTLKLDCADSAWSAGAIDGDNADIKARVVNTLKDYAVLSLKMASSTITDNRGVGELDVTIAGIQ